MSPIVSDSIAITGWAHSTVTPVSADSTIRLPESSTIEDVTPTVGLAVVSITVGLLSVVDLLRGAGVRRLREL